jgi:hypothetical protein
MTIEDITTETTTIDASADEPATGTPPPELGDDPVSPAESTTEEQVEESPEQLAARTAEETKRAARMKVAEEAEKRAEAERTERRRKLELQDVEERIARREREAAETAERAQRALRDIEARADAIRRGGYDALKALGISYEDWTRKTLEDTGPDALARQALERADRLEAEIKRRDDETAKARQREQAQADEVRVKKSFEGFVDSNADDFPDAAVLAPKVLHTLAYEASEEYFAEHRTWPSFAALLPRLDQKAKELQAEQTKRSAARTRSSTTPSDGTPNTPSLPGQPAKPPTTRTLTPAIAGTRATPPKSMTDDEVDEWAREELRRALAADRKSV